jgi:hypothetical protein
MEQLGNCSMTEECMGCPNLATQVRAIVATWIALDLAGER